jgi:hypothetical protein
MADERERTLDEKRTLDEEGVPDLEGPLPQKAATGDPQEGLAPPNEAPRSSVDRRVVPAEERRDETIDERLPREQPDVDAAGATPQPREQVQTTEPQGTREDTEKDVIAEAAPLGGSTLDPEDDAVRVDREEAESRGVEER